MTFAKTLFWVEVQQQLKERKVRNNNDFTTSFYEPIQINTMITMVFIKLKSMNYLPQSNSTQVLSQTLKMGKLNKSCLL
jgi:hypothetical protein